LKKAHSLLPEDYDKDGDTDIIVGQMHTAGNGKIVLLENKLGETSEWVRYNVGKNGMHNAVAADIDRDGDIDVFTANWTGNPPAWVRWNQSAQMETD
jgi:hypothetical protein